MRTIAKKLLSLSFLLSLFFFQFGVLGLAPQALADNSLINSQEGFQSGEVQQAFGNQAPQDIRYIAARIINIVLTLLGIIFLILLITAGFRYMTAGGNEDQVKASIKQITQAVIGLVIILAAWSITYFIIVRLRAASFGVNYLYF